MGEGFKTNSSTNKSGGLGVRRGLAYAVNDDDQT